MSDYTPSAQLTKALDEYEKLQEDAEAARLRLRAAVADDLKTFGITNDIAAEHLPWSSETVRGIAREFNVPPKRKPTVRSIKPTKRTPKPTA